MAFVEEINNGMRIIPTIVFPDGSVLERAIECAAWLTNWA